ncbi:MAG: AsmA family protein [Pseudomonadota bacterium]
MSLLKRPLVLIAGVLALLLAGLAIIPFLIPTDVYRSQIESAASQALDRQVTLDEDVSLSLLPRLSARVGGVEIANPEGFSRPNMLTAGELRGVVRWAPLLGGRVEISEFVFDRADLQLEVREDGETNWTFGTPDAEVEPEAEPGTSAPPSASIGAARLTNATVTYIDAVNDVRHQVTDLNILARMDDMASPLRVEASGGYQDNPFSADVGLGSVNALLEGAPTTIDLSADIAGARVGFDGSVTNSETPSAEGEFTTNVAALPALLDLVGVDLGYNLAPLGRIEASGTVSGPADTLTVTGISLTTNGEALDSRFTGTVTLGEEITVDGQATVSSENLGAGLTTIGVELPIGAEALEALDARFTVAGPVDALRFSDMEITHRGGLLMASFEGAVGLAGDGAIDGTVEASSDALRPLAAALGSPLPEGDTLNRFALETGLSGSFTQLTASNLTASLDDTTATGSGAVDLRGDKPSITADVTIPTLALDTFLVESEEPAPASSGGQGWSDAAIDLAGLEAVDIDLKLRSDAVSLGDIVLSEADLNAEIEDGRLTATIADAGLFGGQWSGRVSLDGSSAVPAAKIQLDGTAVAIENALSTLAGLESVGGLGRVSLDLDTSGGTVADMVGALTGTVGANLADGRVKGFNAGQLVRSRENIVQALADGSLAVALSDEAETDFTAFDTQIRFDRGIGQLSALSFRNPLVLFDGSGKIDLPNQAVDLSIVPSVDEAAAGQGTQTLAVDGIPIPIRLSGSWFSPSILPDTRLLQQSLQQTALDEVRSRAADRLGGEAGAILDGVLGTGRSGSEDAAGANGEAEGEIETEPAPSAEEAVEGLVRDRLGGLFGRQNSDDEDGGER